MGTFRVALGWLPPEKLADMDKELGEEPLPYLDLALTSTRPEIRAATLEVLRKHPAQEEAILAQALERTRDPSLVVDILTRLAERNGKKELPRIALHTDSTEPSVKVAALGLLGHLGDPAGADAILRKFLADADERARVTAAIALLELHGPTPGR